MGQIPLIFPKLCTDESARREVLSRPWKLNHERWEEEQKAESGTQKAKGGKSKVKGRKANDGQMGLL
jgi:hypothetical protein